MAYRRRAVRYKRSRRFGEGYYVEPEWSIIAKRRDREATLVVTATVLLFSAPFLLCIVLPELWRSFGWR